ncbi:hypothetical protein K493DRAFT_62898 [Basidiobolus meristosporus CBS 931.73]|uniref:Uncharacterized protein n=1 Tax=Basidiobolus meristosporus CBS 931.73 TaxID=1314790 RepID=A0A1Y1XWH9_9FUNG|nr:hypothetical protein K493DRAFT_62898 [Basidiobolus meristosporus CBS 931.73]|eukprot:ORX90083.1 hypothetical protein K493DRAFT_62898 [Basidiobolus meristosporus CBS 931.73]
MSAVYLNKGRVGCDGQRGPSETSLDGFGSRCHSCKIQCTMAQSCRLCEHRNCSCIQYGYL